MGAVEESSKRIARLERKRYMKCGLILMIHLFSLTEQLVAGTQRPLAMSAALEALPTRGDVSGRQD